MANSIDSFGLPTALLSSIMGVEVDAVLSENHRYTSLVTANPIEDGSNISDHIVNLPVILDMEGRFTDTPFGLLSSLVAGSAVGALTTGLTGAQAAAALSQATATALLGEARPGISKTKFKLLVALQVARETITIVTGLQTYENMVIESLSAPRAGQDGKSIRFNAVFKEILVAGDTSFTNRRRVVEELWGSALTPRQLGIVQKAQASFDPTSQVGL